MLNLCLQLIADIARLNGVIARTDVDITWRYVGSKDVKNANNLHFS